MPMPLKTPDTEFDTAHVSGVFESPGMITVGTASAKFGVPEYELTTADDPVLADTVLAGASCAMAWVGIMATATYPSTVMGLVSRIGFLYNFQPKPAYSGF